MKRVQLQDGSAIQSQDGEVIVRKDLAFDPISLSKDDLKVLLALLDD